MALPPITPPGSPSIQPLTGQPLTSGLPTPPQTPQKSGVIDFGKIPPLSLNKNEVEEPAQNEHADKGGFRGAMDKVADKTWAIPGFSAVTGGIADGEPGVGGALKGAAGGVGDVMKNNVESLSISSFRDIPKSPMKALGDAYAKNIENSDRAPEWAKKGAEKLG